jgi:hypothetical protein
MHCRILYPDAYMVNMGHQQTMTDCVWTATSYSVTVHTRDSGYHYQVAHQRYLLVCTMIRIMFETQSHVCVIDSEQLGHLLYGHI